MVDLKLSGLTLGALGVVTNQRKGGKFTITLYSLLVNS